jgi:hypothetical protein
MGDPDAKVLKILVTSVGQPDRTIELPLSEPNGRRRGFWRENQESER